MKIEKWIEKAESVYDASNQIQQRSSYTAIIEDALDKARTNQIDTDALLNRLRRDGDRKLWYEVIELCYDVMAADAIADVGVLRILGDASNLVGVRGSHDNDLTRSFLDEPRIFSSFLCANSGACSGSAG